MLTGKRVLIAEDSIFIAEELRQFIWQRHGRPLVSPTAHVAVKIVEDGEIDLAVVDMQLRDRNAQPVFKALLDRRVPFVIITGYARDSLPRDLQLAPYLGKPFLQAELTERIGSAVAISAASGAQIRLH